MYGEYHYNFLFMFILTSSFTFSSPTSSLPLFLPSALSPLKNVGWTCTNAVRTWSLPTAASTRRRWPRCWVRCSSKQESCPTSPLVGRRSLARPALAASAAHTVCSRNHCIMGPSCRLVLTARRKFMAASLKWLTLSSSRSLERAALARYAPACLTAQACFGAHIPSVCVHVTLYAACVYM